ncbi:hypothetical protein C5470_13125 [Photorhabdus stackebrandtii]|uniref:Uncharacterized protein n=1 Tax=Photorhabdus stackebrandtii TaxID=1123042 RepID=A0A7X5TM23_9GAMM|nr:hypothetical protein [Photorhabdus stackebrandtii]
MLFWVMSVFKEGILEDQEKLINLNDKYLNEEGKYRVTIWVNNDIMSFSLKLSLVRIGVVWYFYLIDLVRRCI